MSGRGRVLNTAFDARIAALAAEGCNYSQIQKALLLNPTTVRKAVKRLGIKVRDGRSERKGEYDHSRVAAMAERYKAGETLKEIGDDYGISRERVRQILRKRTQVAACDGGVSVRAARARKDEATKRDLVYMEKLGCGWGEYKRIRDLGRKMVSGGRGYHQSPMGAYVTQRSNARRRSIEWSLCFWEWWNIWQDSGRWDQRGRGQGYVMCRKNDEGPYAKDNVFIATAIENISSAKHKKKDLPTGVRFSRGAFVAQRGHRGKMQYLGRFKTAALAYAAYVAAAPGLNNRAAQDSGRSSDTAVAA